MSSDALRRSDVRCGDLFGKRCRRRHFVALDEGTHLLDGDLDRARLAGGVGLLDLVRGVLADLGAGRAVGAPRSQWLFLGLSAFFFLLGHPAPFGTIAFGSLFVAALMHERQATRDQDVESLRTTPLGIRGER